MTDGHAGDGVDLIGPANRLKPVEPITVFPARKVITMDAGRPVADAIAVMGGRVVSTGTLEPMQPWLSTYDHTIDPRLQGEVIMPGFIDPHTHPAMSAGFLAMRYIGPVPSPGPAGINPPVPNHDAVLAKLREAAADGKPVIAWGLDPACKATSTATSSTP